MSLLKVAPSVVVSRQVIIAAAVVNAANQLGLTVDMRITSGSDGEHKSDSLHYQNRALDFRTKHLDSNNKHLLAAAVKSRLGKDYDVILEDEDGPNEHLHVEH